MEATPNAAKVLANCVLMHNWQQTDLAKLSGIAAPTVSHHLSGARVIRDDHLAAYIGALDRTEQATLVAAWLRDTLPTAAQDNVLTSEGNRLNEEIKLWRPGLDEEQRQMLEWWAKKLAADDELDDTFRAITRKAGWTPA